MATITLMKGQKSAVFTHGDVKFSTLWNFEHFGKKCKKGQTFDQMKHETVPMLHGRISYPSISPSNWRLHCGVASSRGKIYPFCHGQRCDMECRWTGRSRTLLFWLRFKKNNYLHSWSQDSLPPPFEVEFMNISNTIGDKGNNFRVQSTSLTFCNEYGHNPCFRYEGLDSH